MKSLNFRIIIIIILVVTATACAEEKGQEELLYGRWKLTSRTVDGTPVTLSACESESTIEFQEYNFCILYDACGGDSVFSGWNINSDMLNIAELLPVGFYIEEIDGNTLVIKNNDITGTGDLQVTVSTYQMQ